MTLFGDNLITFLNVWHILLYLPWDGLDNEDGLSTNRFFYIHSSLWTENILHQYFLIHICCLFEQQNTGCCTFTSHDLKTDEIL